MDLSSKKKEHAALKDKLLLVTQENTKLLKEIAREKQLQMKLDEDIQAAEEEKQASNNIGSSRTTVNAAEDKAKLLAIAHRQEQEIQQLESEIQKLRTKRGKYCYEYCYHTKHTDNLQCLNNNTSFETFFRTRFIRIHQIPTHITN
jgi:type IV secretory pathway VirJ component